VRSATKCLQRFIGRPATPASPPPDEARTFQRHVVQGWGQVQRVPGLSSQLDEKGGHVMCRAANVDVKYPTGDRDVVDDGEIFPYTCTVLDGGGSPAVALAWLSRAAPAGAADELRHGERRATAQQRQQVLVERPLEPRAVSRQLCGGVSSLYCGYTSMSQNRLSGKVGSGAVVKGKTLCRFSRS